MFRSKSINQHFMVLILTIIPVNHQLQSAQSATTPEAAAPKLLEPKILPSAIFTALDPKKAAQTVQNRLLSQGIKDGNIDRVTPAANNDTQISKISSERATPLTQAVHKRNLDIVKLLLTTDAEPNIAPICPNIINFIIRIPDLHDKNKGQS